MKNIPDQHGINKNLLLPGGQVVEEVTKVGKSRNFIKKWAISKKLEKVGDLTPCSLKKPFAVRFHSVKKTQEIVVRTETNGITVNVETIHS